MKLTPFGEFLCMMAVTLFAIYFVVLIVLPWLVYTLVEVMR